MTKLTHKTEIDALFMTIQRETIGITEHLPKYFISRIDGKNLVLCLNTDELPFCGAAGPEIKKMAATLSRHFDVDARKAVHLKALHDEEDDDAMDIRAAHILTLTIPDRLASYEKLETVYRELVIENARSRCEGNTETIMLYLLKRLPEKDAMQAYTQITGLPTDHSVRLGDQVGVTPAGKS